jgi:hypothetical protein
MGLALLALGAAIVVSILICQFLIVVAERGVRKRPPAGDTLVICRPSDTIDKSAKASR